MASQTELLADGENISRGLLSGTITEEDLNDSGRIVLGLSRGQVGWDDLTEEAKTLIGLEQPWTVGGAAGQFVRPLMRGAEAGGRAILDIPSRLAETFAPGPRPSGNIVADVARGVSKPIEVLSTLVSPFTEFGRGMAQAPFERNEIFTRRPPGMPSPLDVIGVAGSNLGLLGIPGGGIVPARPPRVPQAAPVRIVEGPPAPPGPVPKELPPHIDFERVSPMAVRGPLGLPPGPPRPLALPLPTTEVQGPAIPMGEMALREGRTKAFTELPPVLPGRGIPPEVEQIIPKRPVRPEPPIPSQIEVAAKRAGVDLTIPGERPSPILDPQGRPIMVPTRKRGAPAEESVPVQKLVDEIATAQSRRPQDVERQLARSLGRHETGREVLKSSGLFDEIRGGNPPSDVPIALEKWRGMGPTERKGVIEFFRAEADQAGGKTDMFRGLLPPVPLPGPEEGQEGTPEGIMQRAAQVAGLSLPLLGLAGLRWRISGSKRALNAFKSEDQRFVVEQVSPDKWRVADMTTKERTVVPTFQAARQWAEQRGTPAQAPPPQTFERTAMGDQSLVPGTPARAMPGGKIQAEVPQGKITETPLFGRKPSEVEEQLKEAQGKLFPLPEAPKGLFDERGAITGPTAAGSLGMGLAGLSYGDTPWWEGGEKSDQDLEEREMGVSFGRRPWHGLPPIPKPPVGPFKVAPPDTFTAEGGPQIAMAGFGGLLQQILRGLRSVRKPLSLPEVPKGLSGEVPRVSPEVLPEFRREVIRPSSSESVVSEVDAVRAEVQASRGGGGPFEPSEGPPGRIPPTVDFRLPSDPPATPAPTASRSAKFFARVKAESGLVHVLPPEDVVAGDPTGTRMVRRTYRAAEDGHLLQRELRGKVDDILAGLPEQDVVRITQVLDTDTPGIENLLPPRLAQVARQLRVEVLDAGADATGLIRERRLTSYFPRFRDTVVLPAEKLVLSPTGQPYLSREIADTLPRGYEAFFHRPRTATDPPSRLGRQGLYIYQDATARHITLNGGFDPLTREPIAGYLNDLQQMLREGQPVEPLRGYVAELANLYIGTPGSRSGTALQSQLARITANVEFSRLIGGNLASPLANLSQQGNTFAVTSVKNDIRGYLDMLDPSRRALAQHWQNLPPLAKVDLDIVHGGATRLDRLEQMSAKTAEISGTLFSLSEKQGNRYHAFLAGLREAEDYGLSGRTAIEYARDVVERTQFPGGGPAQIAAFRHPLMRPIGMFKQFQVRQLAFVKRIVEEDTKDWMAALRGETEVPVEIGGRPALKADGAPAMRPLGEMATFTPFRRTAKYLLFLTAVGGPDALFPGFDDYLREKSITVPGLLPALGIGVANLMSFGIVQPGDVTRSLLFFLPGPLIGHTQDALSAMTGRNWGHGLTEMVKGDLFTPLTVDERTSRAVRGFLPVAGIGVDRLRRGAKMIQTPGEERMAQTALEALGLTPATGALVRRTAGAEEVVRTMAGQPSSEKEREIRRREALAEQITQRRQAISSAADEMVTGNLEQGRARLREAERAMGLPVNSLRMSPQAIQAARERQRMPSEERQRRHAPRDLRRAIPPYPGVPVP